MSALGGDAAAGRKSASMELLDIVEQKLKEEYDTKLGSLVGSLILSEIISFFLDLFGAIPIFYGTIVMMDVLDVIVVAAMLTQLFLLFAFRKRLCDGLHVEKRTRVSKKVFWAYNLVCIQGFILILVILFFLSPEFQTVLIYLIGMDFVTLPLKILGAILITIEMRKSRAFKRKEFVPGIIADHVRAFKTIQILFIVLAIILPNIVLASVLDPIGKVIFTGILVLLPVYLFSIINILLDFVDFIRLTKKIQILSASNRVYR
jgi:hypothetical protein